MKVFIVLACVAISCASAGSLAGYGAGAGASYGTTGHSSQFRSEDNYGNYNFGYDESHAGGASGRREERRGDVVRGSYNLNDADGRQRTVHYVADHAGFRATIETNEPGVDASRDPADVLINKEARGYAAGPLPAPVVAAAPAAPAAPAYAAPAPVQVAPVAPSYRGPLVQSAPVYGAGPVYEAPAPRAFSYSFGAAHPSMSYAAPTYAAPAYAGPAPLRPAYQDAPAY